MSWTLGTLLLIRWEKIPFACYAACKRQSTPLRGLSQAEYSLPDGVLMNRC
jgi:hypothetical protein